MKLRFGVGARWLIGVSMIGMALTAAPVAAQSPSRDASPPDGRPAYLQQGTCEQPGKVVLALALVSIHDVAATPAAASPRPSADGASDNGSVPAAVSVTRLDRGLTDLAGAGLIVRVGPDTNHPADTIACAAIAGTPDADGNLYLGVRPVGNSGQAGVVWLRRDDDQHTTVTLFLIAAPSS